MKLQHDPNVCDPERHILCAACEAELSAEREDARRLWESHGRPQARFEREMGMTSAERLRDGGPS